VTPAEAQVQVNEAGEAQVDVQQSDAAVTVAGANTDTAATTDAAAAPLVSGTDATAAGTTATGAATTVQPVMASDVTLREGYELVPAGEMTADALKGAPVYAAGDEKIGDIKDAIVSADGKVERIIVGVGGFLGIGERDVAYPFDEVSFQRQADGSDLRAYVGTNAADVTNLPEYRAQ